MQTITPNNVNELGFCIQFPFSLSKSKYLKVEIYKNNNENLTTFIDAIVKISQSGTNKIYKVSFKKCNLSSILYIYAKSAFTKAGFTESSSVFTFINK